MIPAIPEPKPSAEALLQEGMDRIERIVAGAYFYHKAKGSKATPVLSELLDQIAKERKQVSASAPANAPAATGDAVRCAELESTVQSMQAKIDSLMLEYCPDEMTPEQVEEWGRNQVRVSPQEEARINAALSADKASGEVGR